MALLIGPWQRATDSANAVVSGAKLRIYEQGTTTLATVYSDDGLTTPASNPLTADSAGWFDLVYATQDQLFDIRVETATGGAASTPIKSWSDQPALGPEGSSLLRDFINARFKVSASSGVVNIEVGDPDPDNTGGSMRLGGWAETQADDIEIDAAAITTTGPLSVGGALSTTGVITENGKKLPGVIQTPATTFTTASTVDIPLTNTPTGVRAWEVYVFDLLMSASSDLRMRLAYDATPTFKTGIADYGYGYVQAPFGSSSVLAYDDAESDYIEFRPAHGTASANARPAFIKFTVYTPNSGANETQILGEMMHYSGTTQIPRPIFFAGTGKGGYGRATYARIYPSTGTLTGAYLVKPLRGFGE